MNGPDLQRLLADTGDDPGAQWLASVIRQQHEGNRAAGGNGARPTPGEFMAPGRKRPWDDIAGTLAAGRNDGVMRLACALRETTSLSLEDATEQMYRQVWPLINQGQGGHGFSEEEFEEVIAAVWRQYPGAAEYAERARLAAADLDANPLPAATLELTDAFLADRVAAVLAEMLPRPYCWAPGLSWMNWTGQYWDTADASQVWNEIRLYFIWLYGATAQAGADQAMLGRLNALLSKARIASIADLVRGHPKIFRKAADFDAQPDLLNTPGGIVDLRTGDIRSHDPGMMITKITSGSYRPGYTHPDWEKALLALDEPERLWFQARVGQAITGYPPTDGIMPVLQGPGSNGKTLMTTDGPVKALGGYADMASHKLIASQRANATEHSTEMADLRGQRLLIGEELSEGRAIDVTALKRIQDVGRIKARYVHKDNISFDASHSLFVTTNYVPLITETDHGTWRRLALLVFPYSFRKPGQPLITDNDRHGDPGLKTRIRNDWNGQHDAIVTWAVGGAVGWYAAGRVSAPPTPRIETDTRTWRASADHILNFWDQFLEAVISAPGEHPPCITAGHLLAVFNAWLGKNGHQPWTHQTFAMRFGAHEETTSRGVIHRVTAKLGNVSWYPGSDLYVPKDPSATQVRAWTGIRFKNPPDQGKQGQVDGLDGPQTNFPYATSRESFISGPSSPSTSFPTSAIGISMTSPPESFLPGPSTSSRPQPARQAGLVITDLETAEADDLYATAQGDNFVRLCGVLEPPGEPEIVTAGELLGRLEAAGEIAGHNIMQFDLPALAWHHGADYDRLAAKARDTELIARQADPPRSRETGTSEDRYGLDQVAERYGVPGKTDELKRLARLHGGYGKIPPDDPEYRSYLEGDLRASAAVAGRLHNDAYTAREHRVAALAGRMSLNGFLVDRELLDQRYAEGEDRKRQALQLMHDGWGLPLGKTVMRGRGAQRHEEEQELDSPLAAESGRAWLAGIWQRYQIPDPPRTAKTGKLSIGSEDLKAVAARPECTGELRSLITLIGIVVATRTVYATALDCLCPDGRVHPVNSFRQASGRWSVLRPGLTVFGKRGGRHVERDIFLPDPGHVLLSLDLSQVDMRGIAGLCQDRAYMALFEPGRDAHQEIADLLGITRQEAKARGHGWNYGLGAARMIREGASPDVVRTFVNGMEARFPQLVGWREMIREQGKAGMILDNGFGRRMRCDPDRAYTVSPALMGQGSARDIMCESLLRLPRETWPMMRVMVHDEIVMSVPKEDVMEVAREAKRAMTWTWRDVPILCDISGGGSWGQASAR